MRSVVTFKWTYKYIVIQEYVNEGYCGLTVESPPFIYLYYVKNSKNEMLSGELFQPFVYLELALKIICCKDVHKSISYN